MSLLTNNWSFVDLIDQIYFYFFIGGLTVSIIIGIAVYAFSSYCFQRIYQRLREPNAWFAWIPFLNIWIMYKAGDQSPWWIIGLFIPLINLIAMITLLVAFIKIVKKLGKNPWLIILMIIPVFHLIVVYHFAS